MTTQAAGRAPAQHFLHPGGLALGFRDDRLETLLGSCVAIILTDPQRTIATMCHIVHSGGYAGAGEYERSAAHAEPALRAMFAMLQARGISPHLCDAYIFGGGNMFPRLVRDSHVGQANSDWAQATLAGLGMRVVACDVGGTVYRRLSWRVGLGEPRVVAVPV